MTYAKGLACAGTVVTLVRSQLHILSIMVMLQWSGATHPLRKSTCVLPFPACKAPAHSPQALAGPDINEWDTSRNNCCRLH